MQAVDLFFNSKKSGECWEWTRAIHNPTGYGWVRWKGRSIHAHRASWDAAYGEVPAGMHVLHRCDNRLCIRPDHLFLGTNLDNVNDMMSKGRQAAKERHPAARLTMAQVEEIRRRYTFRHPSDGGTALAAEFGVSKSHVSGIIHNRFWSR